MTDIFPVKIPSLIYIIIALHNFFYSLDLSYSQQLISFLFLTTEPSDAVERFLGLIPYCIFYNLKFRLWKQARQEVRQHWFIYSYIAAYIEALYMYYPVLLEYTRLV